MLYKSFLEIQTHLNSQLVELGDPILGAVLGLLTGQNVALFGPPGTAKSALADLLASSVSDAKYFSTLMHKTQPIEEIFGPQMISELVNHDRYVRNVGNRFPDCNIAFFDEIGRASPGIRGTLLKGLNEKVFEQDGRYEQMPLLLAIAASNQLLSGEEDQAIFDRFPLRFWIEDPQMDDSWQKIIMMNDPIKKPLIDVKTLCEARKVASQVEMPEDATTLLLAVKSGLRDINIRLSPRRMRQCVQILKGYAYLLGCEVVDSDAFEILSHILWEEPKDRKAIAAVITEIAAPIGARIQAILDIATQQMRDLGGFPTAGDAQAWINKAVEVQTALTQQQAAIQEILKYRLNHPKGATAITQMSHLQQQLTREFAKSKF